MHPSTLCYFLSVALACSGASLAQQGQPPAGDPFAAQPASRAVLGQARGLEVIDGVLRAAARDYKVDFRAGGFAFTCPLGADAPRSLPLVYELESVRVGAAELLRVAAPRAPQQADMRVLYAHGQGVEERYDVLPAGIEQSFALAELPSRTGELVVRGRVATELAAPAPGAQAAGLEFRDGDRGGVRIGAVLGIDAAGRRASGELRFDGTHLEYVLPADFVATAALPLVVDPLIGSILTPYSDADSGDPDAAYDDAGDTYLVAFERQWSGSDIDIYAQRVTGAGALSGALMFLEPTISTLAINPAVAYANIPNSWLVVWQQGVGSLGPWDIAAKAVNQSGLLSPVLVIASTTANEIDPDAWAPHEAGDPIPSVIVVWDAHGAGIRGAWVTVGSSPSAALQASFTVSSDSDDSKPAISRGGPSRALIAWQRFFTFPIPGDHDLLGRMVDSHAGLLTTETTVLSSLGPDEQDLDVDGNGTDFAVAFEARAVLGTGGSDVHCQRMRYTAGTSSLAPLGSPVPVAADAAKNEVDPAIGFLGPKYALAWSVEVAGLDFDMAMRLLDPADCSACDGAVVPLAVGASYTGRAEIATRRSALTTPNPVSSDQALVVFETTSTTLPFEGDIQAQQIEAIGTGGAIANIGGGCGSGGTIAYNGPAAIGNPAVSITLSGADPAAVLGFINTAFGPTAPVACGACLWEPFSPLVATRAVVGGNATFTSFVPCDPGLIGAVLRYQWTVVFTASSPCVFQPNISLSDRLQVTYGE